MFATEQELADHLRIPIDELVEDHLTRAIADATAVIQSHAEQTIESVDDEQELEGTWASYLQLPELPVATVDSVVIFYPDGSSLALPTEAFTFNRRGQLFRRFGGHFGGPDAVVIVKYTRGYTDVPPPIRAVCLSLAARLFANPTGALQEQVMQGGVTHAAPAVGFTETEARILKRYRVPVR